MGVKVDVVRVRMGPDRTSELGVFGRTMPRMMYVTAKRGDVTRELVFSEGDEISQEKLEMWFEVSAPRATVRREDLEKLIQMAVYCMVVEEDQFGNLPAASEVKMIQDICKRHGILLPEKVTCLEKLVSEGSRSTEE